MAHSSQDHSQVQKDFVNALQTGNISIAEQLIIFIPRSLATIRTTIISKQKYGRNCTSLEKALDESAAVSPLHLAAYWGWKTVVTTLITEFQCAAGSKDDLGHSPLHYAACNGHLEVVRYFIEELHCSLLDGNDIGDLALHYACNNGHLDIAQYLIKEKHCDPSCENQLGNTPLHYACQNGQLKIAQYLIRKCGPNCNLSCTNKEGNTPLHIACRNGHFNIVKYLISKGCDPSCENIDRWTPLHFACGPNGTNQFRIVKYLVNEKQCDPSCKNKTQYTPFHQACRSGHLDIAEFFFNEKDCDPSFGDHHGTTPLHFACMNGHLKVVDYLIGEKECDPSCQDKNGWTPLHYACSANHTEIVQYLLSTQQVDPQAKNKEGCNAFYYANGKDDIIKLLKQPIHTITKPIISSSPTQIEVDGVMNKLGYNVTVSISNVTTHGPPATGKTSVIDLAMGRPPNKERHSTGIAEPPTCSIIVRGTEDVEWKELTPDEMLDALCKTINKLKDRLPEPADDHLETETVLKHEETSGTEQTSLSVSSAPLPQSPTSDTQSQLVSPSLFPKHEQDYCQILNDIIKRLPKVNEPTTLSKASLILMSDSGGQPNYLDVFPLFVRNKCLTLFTLKLNERLDDIPQFSYHIRGHQVSIAETAMQYSHWRLLESLAKSVSSFHPSLQSPSSQHDTRFAIIGTFFDKSDDLKEETISNKNYLIAENLKAYEKVRIDYKGEPIFPINAITSDGSQRKEYMMELRRKINEVGPCIEIGVKLLWFAFYLSMLSSAKAKQRAILSLQECVVIGRSLDMDERETRKAIKLFHNLNLIFHYQTENFDSCFTIVDLKPIFDLVSNLIGLSFINEEELHSFFDINLPPGVREHFQKYGCFDQDTLQECFQNRFPKLLNAEVFINLLAEVKAVAIIGNSKSFFMPCVLCYASREEECKIIKDHSLPWIVQLKASKVYAKHYVPLPPSFSPTLIVLLLTSESFSIDIDRGYRQYRNIFTLQFKDRGDVIIIERQLQLEIYYSFSDSDCSRIRSLILKSILETKEKLNIADSVQVEESFLCSCSPEIEGQHRYILCKPTPGETPYGRCNHSTNEKIELNQQELRWLVQDNTGLSVAVMKEKDLPSTSLSVKRLLTACKKCY